MPPATPGRTVAKRCFQKCEQCRRKKIKCTPEDRDDFHTSGRKCDQCFTAGEPCSANTRVQRKSGQNQINVATTPLPSALSPSASFNNVLDPENSQLGLHDLRIQSPTQSFESVFSPQSQVSSYDTELWRPEESHYMHARAQLRDMGLSVELYEYCHHRKNAMISMTQALSLIDFSRAVSSLDMLLQTVSMSIMTALKAVLQVIQRPVQHTSSEHELLCRRVLGIGRRLSGCGGHFDAARNSHFNQILNTIRNELVKLYTSQHDSAEANCLRMMPGRRSQYLEGLTENTLPSLSTNLLKSMDSAVGDILEPARKGLDLDPGRPSRISATHLALLSNRLYGNIDARDVGFDMSCDMIGRNALHIAVERADVDYVRAWLEETKNNPSLLSNTKDKRDIFGLTPLMISAYQGCVDVFRLLLEAGAELKPQTRSGRSLLSLAAMAGNESIVAEILSRGVKIQDHINFCSPIHDAAASGRSESIILLLLEHNAEPRYEHPAYPGQCASKVAREKGHRKIARILQDAETRLNATKPVSDDIVKHLQERLDHMANSSSPDSPSTTISTSRLSPGIETNRRVKRQRSIHYEYNSSPMSSSSSTPRVQPTNPAGPSPLFQVTNRPSFADASGNLNDPASSPFHYFLDPSSDYSILDLESSFGNT